MAVLPVTLSLLSPPLSDMDECETFGSEFCRNGQCLNTVPGYKCFCRTGYFYDPSRLECVGKMASKSSGATTVWRDRRAAAPNSCQGLPVTLLGMGEVAGSVLAGNEPRCPCLPA